MKRRMRILFICSDGATKSTMAAALTARHAASDIQPDAAGLYTALPATETTRRVIEAKGLPLPAPPRRAPEAFTRHADLIVSFSPGAQSMFGRPTRHWRTQTRAVGGDAASHEQLLEEIEALVLELLDEQGARATSA